MVGLTLKEVIWLLFHSKLMFSVPWYVFPWWLSLGLFSWLFPFLLLLWLVSVVFCFVFWVFGALAHVAPYNGGYLYALLS